MRNLPGNLNLAGAVSLDPKPAGGAAAPRSEFVLDVTDATFGDEVLDRSFQVPVLIDFWADWCQPCKKLSPILEKLAAEGNGSWILAKVDTEANPRLHAAAQVRSIPTVKAMVDGQVVDEFIGALPEAQVRQFLNNLPRPSQGAPGAEAPADPDMDEAEACLVAGDLEGAVKGFERVLARDPSEPDATIGLAGVKLLQRVAERPEKDADEVTKVGYACDMAVLQGRPDMAVTELVDLVKRTAGDERQRARKHLLSVFDALGPADPIVVQGRRDLTNALF